MKSFNACCFVYFILLTFSGSVYAQNIFPVVEGNNVTLWETAAERNCGAFYIMEVELNDNHMIWRQVDSGGVALCMCIFDLSVTYGPLEPGDYIADVFYTMLDMPGEFYEGSTSFTIGNARGNESGGIISQYQSDCYAGVDDPESDKDFRIYPVPLADGEILNVEAAIPTRKAVLEIFTLTGKQVFSKQYENSLQIRDTFSKHELFPVPGMYVVRLRNDDQIFVKKITVL